LLNKGQFNESVSGDFFSETMETGRFHVSFGPKPFYPICLRIYTSGVKPTTVSYNASAVKIYNATSSLGRLENKIIFFYFEKTL
jgi:hypothetical protein